jgi:putative hemolysin
MAPTLISCFIFAFCLGLSFLLSGMEAGVFALSRLRIRQQMRAGRRSAWRLHHYLENPENFLWTILVGNTLVNFLILGWIIPLLHTGLGGDRILFALVYAVIVFLFYAFFDLLPKMLFRKYPNRLCLVCVRPFRFVHLMLRPLVALVERGSVFVLKWTGGKTFTGRLFGNREELRQVMQESGQSLSSEERTMINRVLDLQSLTVRQLTTPLAQAVTVNDQTPIREALAQAVQRGVMRLPVWQTRDGQRRIMGLVFLKPLLYQSAVETGKPVGDYARPALYLEEDLRLEVALGRMQRGGQRLAVVLGRDGRETGIISLEDILKFIFGEVKL